MQPWQLLVPDLRPNNPPLVRDVTDTERRLWERLDGLMKAAIGMMRGDSGA